VQPAGNHQVQHEPEVTFYSYRDSLADSSQFAHDAAFHFDKGWLCGSKQKRARQSYSLDRLRKDAWLERCEVGGNIRQFRHAHQIAAGTQPLQPSFL